MIAKINSSTEFKCVLIRIHSKPKQGCVPDFAKKAIYCIYSVETEKLACLLNWFTDYAKRGRATVEAISN